MNRVRDKSSKLYWKLIRRATRGRYQSKGSVQRDSRIFTSRLAVPLASSMHRSVAAAPFVLPIDVLALSILLWHSVQREDRTLDALGIPTGDEGLREPTAPVHPAGRRTHLRNFGQKPRGAAPNANTKSAWRNCRRHSTKLACARAPRSFKSDPSRSPSRTRLLPSLAMGLGEKQRRPGEWQACAREGCSLLCSPRDLLRRRSPDKRRNPTAPSAPAARPEQSLADWIFG